MKSPVPLPTRRLIRSLVAVTLLIMVGVVAIRSLTPQVYGTQLGIRAFQLTSSEASAETGFALSFQYATAGTLGSVLVLFCANDPILSDPCVPPAGLDTTNLTLDTQTGPNGFGIDTAATTGNQLLLTRAPAPVATDPASYEFSHLTNPSAPGSYYVRLQTFATSDASGPSSDYGGIAYSIANQISVSATVPPYLIFCTGLTIPSFNCANAEGDYIDFGELSSQHASSGSSQMLVATNALDGYGITATGTTLTSGTNFIAAMAANDVSRPGVSQFGLNLRANAAPAVGSEPSGPGVSSPAANYGIPDSFRFVSGETIVNNPHPDNIRLYTASYIVNVPVTQAPGIYVSTITYICLADF